MSKKIAVYHDYFAIRGGGERLVLTLTNALHASLVFGYRTAETYDISDFPEDRRDLRLSPPLQKSGLRPLALASLFRRQQSLTSKFDTRIFSGVAAPFAAPPRSSTKKNIYYCHTPPRFLFDQREYFLARLPKLMRGGAAVTLKHYEGQYRAALDRMDIIVANSRTVQQRISRYLSKDSIVINPPIDTQKFKWSPAGGYYLSTARLTALKQVDKIVDAFLDMPDKRLIVTSGGEELPRLIERARGAENIQFTGWTSESSLISLVSQSIATIYVPRGEDFGMSPVESMSAGKPVIGVADGGVRETVLEGETGLLLPIDFSTQALKAAVHKMTPGVALKMRAACERRASRFTQERFIAQMEELCFGT